MAAALLPELLAISQKLKGGNGFYYKQTVVGVKSKREDESRTRLTFLYGLTIGAVKAFHLSSSGEKNQGARTHYIDWYSIFIFQLQSKLANM